MDTTREIGNAVTTRALVRITERNGRHKGVTGIALGYNAQYDSIKVGFIDANGNYTGDYTTVAVQHVEVIQAAPEPTQPQTRMRNTTAAVHTHCLRCGRALHSTDSQARGYGRTCRAKVIAAAKAKAAADFKPDTAAKALELIEMGGIVAIRGRRVFRTISSDGIRTYLTAPQACNCAAGLKAKYVCFHRAAAAIMLAA